MSPHRLCRLLPADLPLGQGLLSLAEDPVDLWGLLVLLKHLHLSPSYRVEQGVGLLKKFVGLRSEVLMSQLSLVRGWLEALVAQRGLWAVVMVGPHYGNSDKRRQALA